MTTRNPAVESSFAMTPPPRLLHDHEIHLRPGFELSLLSVPNYAQKTESYSPIRLVSPSPLLPFPPSPLPVTAFLCTRDVVTNGGLK